MIIWETPADAQVPFLLKFNINTQLRYLNTTDTDTTFTDHLGVSHAVHHAERHHRQSRDVHPRRLRVRSAGTIQLHRVDVRRRRVNRRRRQHWLAFNKAFTLTGGYTGVPGSRSLVATFPFFTSTDRSMADNFFRPGFTQGAWANGEPWKGLNYLAFVGNGLNTLSISANKIDTHLLAGRQRLVGTDGRLWGTRQVAQHVRRLRCVQERAHSLRDGVHAVP